MRAHISRSLNDAGQGFRDVELNTAGLVITQPKAQLCAAPEEIVGVPDPLICNHPVKLARGDGGAEILAEIGAYLLKKSLIPTQNTISLILMFGQTI